MLSYYGFLLPPPLFISGGQVHSQALYLSPIFSGSVSPLRLIILYGSSTRQFWVNDKTIQPYSQQASTACFTADQLTDWMAPARWCLHTTFYSALNDFCAIEIITS